MAKKRRSEEEVEEEAFEFPEFDEKGYLAHEFEQSYATIIAFVLGVVLGGVAYLIGSLSVPVEVPLAVGVGGTAASALLIQRIRPASSEYTKGDWAALVVLIFFGFLGIWFLLADVASAALAH